MGVAQSVVAVVGNKEEGDRHRMAADLCNKQQLFIYASISLLTCAWKEPALVFILILHNVI